jgi:hypothetical protein
MHSSAEYIHLYRVNAVCDLPGRLFRVIHWGFALGANLAKFALTPHRRFRGIL